MNKFRFKTRFLLLILFFIGSYSIYAGELRVGSYNLRYDNPGDSLDNWKFRKDVLAKQVLFHNFDIFGTQEGLHHQLEELTDGLSEYTPYNYIGVGRDDGARNGEYAAIFYKTEMFELLDKGDFWLSEDPTQPNKGWDAVLPRICSWGKFREKSSDVVFYFFNVHFDHVGKEARKESSKLIIEKIEEYADGYPVLLTGDFNVDQTSDSYHIMNNSDMLTDAYEKASLHYGARGTFNGFNINAKSNSRIDHIFVTDHFKVYKHGVLTDSYQTSKDDLVELANTGAYPQEISLFKNQARLPSDHYPVLVIMEYRADAE